MAATSRQGFVYDLYGHYRARKYWWFHAPLLLVTGWYERVSDQLLVLVAEGAD